MPHHAPHHRSLLQPLPLPVLNATAGAITPGPRRGSAESREANEKCGVFGIWSDKNAARSTYFGLFSLQHRGQESAGIAVTDRRIIERHAGMGLVSSVFEPEDLNRLTEIANAGPKLGGAVGHNRYSTTGSSSAANAQPFTGHYRGGPVALAHNGNLTNALILRKELEAEGHAFHTDSDTEVMLQLIAARAANDAPITAALATLEGAFSVVILHTDRLQAARDPWGFRPLVLGQLPSEDGEPGAYCVASETIALDTIGARVIREVEPGELITITDDGVQSERFADPVPRRAHCVFEQVYFASPASKVFGQTVQRVREMLGETLAKESAVPADMVVPMPDSGRSAATGYARASGLPYREGIIPNRYVGRTFIKPTDGERVDAVRLKLNVISDVVKDQRVVIVDDSIVRGTTTRHKMQQLRAAGAKEIHLRIACPPITHPCFFGVDFPDRAQLIANRFDIEGIRDLLGVDSLHYLSLDGLLNVAQSEDFASEHFCTACYSGDYRIQIDPSTSKEILAKNC